MRRRAAHRRWPVIAAIVAGAGAVACIVLLLVAVTTPRIVHVFQYDTVALGPLRAGTVWQGVQAPSVDGTPQGSRIRVVATAGDLARGVGGVYQRVLRVELRPFAGGAGDATTTSTVTRNRAEVWGRRPLHPSRVPPSNWPDPVGSERWYDYSIFLPSDWAFAGSINQWVVFTQWKGEAAGSPPLSLQIVGKEWALVQADGSFESLGRVQTGVWTAFDIGVHFSPSPDTGWIQAQLNGETVLPRFPVATMQRVDGRTDPVYLKMGIYRSSLWNTTNVAYFGPMIIREPA